MTATKTIVLAVILCAAAYAQPAASDSAGPAQTYQNYCAGCHGAQMEGGQHSPLRKTSWMYGDTRRAMLRTVMYGIAGTEMAAWSHVLPKEQLEAVVDYIIQSRDTLPPKPEAKPDTIQTADYLVHIETVVADGFNSAPWGIEFVDERRALITEQRGGMRWMVDGKLDPQPITGIPETVQYGRSATGAESEVKEGPVKGPHNRFGNP